MFVQLSEVSGQAVSCSSCGATSVIRFIMSRADQSMGGEQGEARLLGRSLRALGCLATRGIAS